jgi:DNA polymerase-3 subunit gamma/tau
MANENRHIDIIEMDAASSRKIDDIRELIEHTKYKPSIARYKIFIIDEVHMLTREAFNALLKTLEEPPTYVKFILATTDPLKLPATILSRTQHFRFKQISKNETIKHLAHILNLENINYTPDALEIVARAGSGSLRDTLTLLDQAIIFSKGSLNASNVASMLGLLDPMKIEEIYETVLNEDRKNLLTLIKELDEYESETIIDEMIAYLKDRYFEQDARYSTMVCERFLRILSESKNLLYINANDSFVLILVFFKMLEALNIKKIDDMIATIESDKSLFVKTENITQNEPKQENTKTNHTLSQPELLPSDNDEKIEQAAKQSSFLNKNIELFEKLITKMSDRSVEIGECFENAVKFVSFEDGILKLTSNAQDENRLKLRQNWSVIKHLIQDTFGIETKINVTQIEVKLPPKQEDDFIQEQKTDEINTDEIKEQSDKTPLSEHPFVKKALDLLGQD